MPYEQFVERMEKMLRESAGEGRTLYIRSVTKNNGKERRGIVFCEPGINVSPTIYLEEYYERYRRGCPFEEVARQILELYGRVKVGHSWEGEYLTKYENVKPRIIYQLINRKKNTKILQEIPHIPYLDLEIIFHVLVDMDDDRIATMLVRNEHLELWDVTKENVYLEACRNTEKLLPSDFGTLYALMTEMRGGEEDEKEAAMEEETGCCMYVLTNRIRNYGAAAVLYKNTLKNIGLYLKEDFYVLPSSVHEMIIVPESSAPSWWEIGMIVKEINATQVKEEEVLSDVPYKYVRREDTLNMPLWEGGAGEKMERDF